MLIVHPYQTRSKSKSGSKQTMEREEKHIRLEDEAKIFLRTHNTMLQVLKRMERSLQDLCSRDHLQPINQNNEGESSTQGGTMIIPRPTNSV